MAVKKPKISLSSIVDKSKEFEQSILNPVKPVAAEPVKQIQHIESNKQDEITEQENKPVEIIEKKNKPTEIIEKNKITKIDKSVDYEILSILEKFNNYDIDNDTYTCPITINNKQLLKTICSVYSLAGKKMTIQTLLHNIIENWKKNNEDEINKLKTELIKNM